MNLNIGKVFTSKFVATGPSSYKKIIYRAAVSQRLRNTAQEIPRYSPNQQEAGEAPEPVWTLLSLPGVEQFLSCLSRNLVILSTTRISYPV